MSRGPGLIQRQLAAFLAKPHTGWFTVRQLATEIYGDAGRVECLTVNRALKGLPVDRRYTGGCYIFRSASVLLPTTSDTKATPHKVPVPPHVLHPGLVIISRKSK
jgi:hypothetical protein